MKPRRAGRVAKPKKSRRAVPKVLQAIHKNIRKLRKSRGLHQSHIAKAAKTTLSAVSHWERGLSAPTADRIPKVADVLGVSVDALYAEDAA